MTTAFTLAKRLFQLGAIETQPDEAVALTKDEARDAILGFACGFAVCCRDAKGKPLRFSEVYALVYGEELQVRKADGKRRKMA